MPGAVESPFWKDWRFYALLAAVGAYALMYGVGRRMSGAGWMGIAMAGALGFVLYLGIRRREAVSIGGAELDVRAAVAILLGTLLPMLHQYGLTPFRHIVYDQTVLFLGLPLLVALLVFRQPLRDYGFALGNWKEGLLWTAAGIALMAPVIYFLVHSDPAFKDYYHIDQRSALEVIFDRGLEMLAWEYIWRGFYLFALLRVMGPGPAILLQAVPFAYLHFEKPVFVETLSTPFGGAAFGFIAWRTGAFWPAWLVHWFQIAFLDVLVRSL
jgi:membrane protease YdiL (CAAX protease family)